MWKELSNELSAAVKNAAPSLVHIGGRGITGRTGILWRPGLLVTLAREARDGETVAVVWGDGRTENAVVKAWDSRTGLTILAVEGSQNPGWKRSARPAVGSVVLTVAAASPAGVEARFDLIRYSGDDAEWNRGVKLSGLVQTDGNEWPGFRSAAVIDAEGHLVGLVAENRSGNDGFVVLASDVDERVQALEKGGSVRPARLGVSTRPAGGQGLLLHDVEKGSPAEAAGWARGDLLLQVAGQKLVSPQDLVNVLETLTPGTSVSAKLVRGGEVYDWPVTARS